MISKFRSIIRMLEDKTIRRFFRFSTILALIILLLMSLLTDVNVREGKEYSDWDHVALYILKFDGLPSNYVHKSQGVSTSEYDVTVFDVYDNTRTPIKLPVGYNYTEVYINATKDDIGQERFVFSNDQLYYTSDHYNTFEEVNRFDVLGVHYIISTIFWIVFTGTSGVMICSFKWEVITVETIKDDFKSDWILIKKFTNDRVKVLREKIES